MGAASQGRGDRGGGDIKTPWRGVRKEGLGEVTSRMDHAESKGFGGILTLRDNASPYKRELNVKWRYVGGDRI